MNDMSHWLSFMFYKDAIVVAEVLIKTVIALDIQHKVQIISVLLIIEAHNTKM